MSELKVPFGVNKAGRLVGAETVERGGSCECACPECREPLVAAKGDVLRHHFRHSSKAACAGALETSLHKFAKQTICGERNPRLPKFGAWEFDYGQANFASPEYRLFDGSIVADVLLEYVEETIAIEIFVAHAVGKEKVEKYAENGHAAMEIDLSNVRWKDASEDEWRSIILRKSSRRWLVLPRKAREWLEMRRQEVIEKKKEEIKSAEERQIKAESERIEAEKLLRGIREETAKKQTLKEATRRLLAAKEREIREIYDHKRLQAELENKRSNEVGAEMRLAMREQLKVERLPPDMQKMVEAYGGYNLIPEEAWLDYGNRMEIWNVKNRSGAFYDVYYKWLEAVE